MPSGLSVRPIKSYPLLVTKRFHLLRSSRDPASILIKGPYSFKDNSISLYILTGRILVPLQLGAFQQSYLRLVCKNCGIQRHSDLNARRNICRIALSANTATGSVNLPDVAASFS